jgi:hypothetical protein
MTLYLLVDKHSSQNVKISDEVHTIWNKEIRTKTAGTGMMMMMMMMMT